MAAESRKQWSDATSRVKGLTPNQNIHLSNLCSLKLTVMKYEFWSYSLAPKIFKHFTVELNSILMQPILVPLESRHVLLTTCKTGSGYENVAQRL